MREHFQSELSQIRKHLAELGRQVLENIEVAAQAVAHLITIEQHRLAPRLEQCPLECARDRVLRAHHRAAHALDHHGIEVGGVAGGAGGGVAARGLRVQWSGQQRGHAQGDGAAAARLFARGGLLAEETLDDVSRALAAYEHAVELSPDVEVLDALASIHVGREEFGEAVAWLKQRLSLTDHEQTAARRATRWRSH